MRKLHHAYKTRAQKWKPDGPQLKAVKFLLEHAEAGLILDPGFGKTAVSLAAFSYLKEVGKANRAIVLAPARVMSLVWPAEITKWADFNGLTYAVIHGRTKEKDLWAAIEDDVDILITNFESLQWLLNINKTKHKVGQGWTVKADRRRFRKLGVDTLIIDELSKFKHTTSVRYGALKQVVHMFERRWGLTGSPASNGLLGLFGQCFILDQGAALGRFITHYRRRYFDKDEFGYSYTLKPGAEEQIYKACGNLLLRIDEVESGIKLPRVEVNTIPVELPDKVRKIYEELRTTLVAQIDDKEVTAANAATASTKLRQITAGAIYADPSVEDLLTRHKLKQPKAKREVIPVHTEKVSALDDFLNELEGQPVLIAYDFQHDLDAIKNLPRYKKLKPEDFPYIGGGVTETRAAKLEKLWLSGKLTELYGHPQSIAHGLNLQFWGDSFPRHVLWYSLTWDYELYDQFIRRIRRRGNQASRVFVHHMIARHTIDENILGALFSKRRGQNALFEALKELRKPEYTP